MFESIATHNGTITVENPATGNHRTFKIHTQAADARFAPGQRIVSLMTGNDNVNDFTGFGFVTEQGQIRLWRSKQTEQFRKLAMVLENPERAQQQWGMQFMWAATCRCCNRKLTTPQAIRDGIGPVCSGKQQSA